MTSKERDKLARGPNPRSRIEPPKPGERCPRCHASASSDKPCLLHNPEAVPSEFRL